jgi:ABC-type branched-subunit amino acid transport system ATPase component
MRTIVINGTSCIGKTTLMRCLQANCTSGKSALLDGDDVIRVAPFELSLTWLDLVQDNLLARARNFERFGVENLYVAFPFPDQARVDSKKQAVQRPGAAVGVDQPGC